MLRVKGLQNALKLGITDNTITFKFYCFVGVFVLPIFLLILLSFKFVFFSMGTTLKNHRNYRS